MCGSSDSGIIINISKFLSLFQPISNVSQLGRDRALLCSLNNQKLCEALVSWCLLVCPIVAPCFFYSEAIVSTPRLTVIYETSFR